LETKGVKWEEDSEKVKFISKTDSVTTDGHTIEGVENEILA